MTIDEFSDIIVSCGFEKEQYTEMSPRRWYYKNYMIFEEYDGQIIIRPFVAYENMCLQTEGFQQHFGVDLIDITESKVRSMCEDQFKLIALHEKLNKIYTIEDRKKALEEDFDKL